MIKQNLTDLSKKGINLIKYQNIKEPMQKLNNISSKNIQNNLHFVLRMFCIIIHKSVKFVILVNLYKQIDSKNIFFIHLYLV